MRSHGWGAEPTGLVTGAPGKRKRQQRGLWFPPGRGQGRTQRRRQRPTSPGESTPHAALILYFSPPEPGEGTVCR